MEKVVFNTHVEHESSCCHSVGIDIVPIKRLEQMVNRWDQKVLDKLFTSREVDYCRTSDGFRWRSLAGFFSAKEAVIKSIHGASYSFNEIEVSVSTQGCPFIVLHGKTKEIVNQLGIKSICISISHDDTSALAVALAL
ncbi:holo-ACP synthase [Paenibacillus sp. NPDC055715]